jgi:RecF/RecN/SMC N terminal domain
VIAESPLFGRPWSEQPWRRDRVERLVGERVTRLAMSAFRGVRDTWQIEFPRAESAVVLGDNGTGKSTIADALEWYFRGRIEFLAREGREKAIRHVGAAKGTPTVVEVATTGSLGGGQRARAAAGGPWVVAKVRDNFVLRGRTLSEFVEQPKAQKWKTLADILGLQEVDSLRLDLQTVRNQVETEVSRAARETMLATAALEPRLQHVNDEGLLAAIRGVCKASHLAEPSSLDEALDPEWATALGPSASTERAVAASTLLADVKVLRGSPPALDGVEKWNQHVTKSDKADADRLRFMSAAEKMLDSQPDSGTCPLCGQPANRLAMVNRVGLVLDELRLAAEQHEEAVHALQSAIDALADYEGLLRKLLVAARNAGISDLAPPPASPSTLVGDALDRGGTVPASVADAYLAKVDSWLETLELATASLQPGPTRESGLIGLGALCEQGRRWRSASAARDAAQRTSALAAQLHASYQAAERDHYTRILDAISSRVAELYESLHPGEGLAGVAVEPWTEKGLELSLDFHGIHQRPPHGVLSESHLNSLAVALFLAMAEMFNERLDLLVLDDVINSFDIEHRGRLAELLVAEFSQYQLIVLTHDHQFYQHLSRRARAWSTMLLTSWSYDEGPRTSQYSTGRFVDAAQQALSDGDIQNAASKSRRALEEVLDEACEALEASLPFRRGSMNDRREFGELMSGLRSRLKTTARGWYPQLDPLLTDLEADVQAALNVEAHAAAGWASSQEVQDALSRVRALDTHFTCSLCGSRIWAKGNRDAGRCNCGASTYPPAPASS